MELLQNRDREGEAEAVVIVKASPQYSKNHRETVCCAAISLDQNWLRLYPVSFRTLDEGKSFKRWDRIRFKWRLPIDDKRVESRRIDQQSLEILGSVKTRQEKASFLKPLAVTSLKQEREKGKSFALLKTNIHDLIIERKPDSQIADELKTIQAINSQPDLFNSKKLIPREPCPFLFKYVHRDEDGMHRHTCQDWETEATFFKWRRRYGEEKTLALMREKFGEEYSKKGIYLAMGTHSLYPDVWLLNGILRVDDTDQMSLF